MLLKRSLVLAAGVLLFLVAFIGYSQYSHAVMEAHFRDVRKEFGVEGATLTSSSPALSPAVSQPANPAFDTNAQGSPIPPATTDTSAPSAPADTNAPAPNNTAPQTTPPTPADSNAAPTSPSTMNGSSRPGIFQFAAYQPFPGAEVRLATAATGEVDSNAPAAAPAPAPTTPAPAPAVTSAAAPEATSAPGHSADATTGSVIVLLYHQFRPAGVPISPKFLWTMHQDVFASEMKYIHDNGYNVIPMSQLLAFLRHEGTVPPRAVVITIDDGYKSAIVYAAPILKQYGYPWTYFIYPDYITEGEGGPNGAASWNDLLELQKEGIDIECHSMTHPILPKHRQKYKGSVKNLSPDEYADFLKTETAGAKAVLEQHMGKKITCFAYPYGEYNTQVEQAAIDAGFDAIFTVADNPVHATTSLHSIGRYTITTPVERNFAAYLRQGALGLTSADPAPGATISDPRPVITAVLGYPGSLDPKSLETSIGDQGVVRHDFDPATNTLRLYLKRDLIASRVLVNIRVEDATSHQVMVANWHFNYEPAAGAPATHAAIAPGAKAAASAGTTAAPDPAKPAVSAVETQPSAPAPAIVH